MSNSNSHLIQKLNIKKILRRLKLKLKKTQRTWKNLWMDKLIISKFIVMGEMNLLNQMKSMTFFKIKKRRKRNGFFKIKIM